MKLKATIQSLDSKKGYILTTNDGREFIVKNIDKRLRKKRKQRMKNEIIYKKGDVISADEQYINPLPFHYYKTLTELLDDYYSGFLDDEVIINIIIKLEKDYEASIASDGVHIILKSIKITIEELENEN